MGIHLIALVALLVLQQAHADEVAPNVVVDGVEVGGLSEAELTAAVDERAEERRALDVEVVAEDDAVATVRGELGVSFATEPAVADAWGHGRGWWWPALAEQIQIRRGEWYEVELPRDLDRQQLQAFAEQAGEELSREARSAEVGFAVDDDEVVVEVTEPVEGRAVDVAELADRLERLLDDLAPISVEAPVEDVDPPTVTQADLDAAIVIAERAIAEPVTLAHPVDGPDLVLEPEHLATLVEIVTDEDADEGERLRFVGDGERLEHLLEEDEGLDPLRLDPVEATIELEDDEVVIDGGTDGFEPDLDAAAEVATELATTEEADRSAELPGDLLEPDLSRADAEDLGIEQEVSTFSTPLNPGEPRNENLALAAEMIDGDLILPGESYSLNQGIGERTEDRGFVENGFIDEEGELVSVLGGGISQMGTTFLNAAWFAGIEIVQFRPHSLYFERYPKGREATLIWEALDVVVENDSPYGILIEAEGTDDEVTVTFWSTPWAEVETDEGEPYDEEEGEVRDGFTIDFGRTITYPDGSTSTETYTHTYVPEDESDDDNDD